MGVCADRSPVLGGMGGVVGVGSVMGPGMVGEGGGGWVAWRKDSHSGPGLFFVQLIWAAGGGCGTLLKLGFTGLQ